MRHVVIDAETAAIADVETYLVEPVEAPSNWKDPIKIVQYIKDAKAAQSSKAALDVDLARIVALGWHIGDESGVSIFKDEVQERTGLGEFWHRFWPVYMPGQTVAIGFNILGFDAPLLLRRSLYLGVVAPRLQLDRYKHVDIVDLMTLLNLDGRLKTHSLRFYCQRFGIPVDDESIGADIAGLVAAEDWEAVAHHCTADVAATHALAVRMGVLKGEVPAVIKTSIPKPPAESGLKPIQSIADQLQASLDAAKEDPVF